MNKKEIERVQEFLDEPITAENLQPLVPTFPKPTRFVLTHEEFMALPVEKVCHAGKDGECNWKSCPQVRDGEPDKTGRHCPIDYEVEEW